MTIERQIAVQHDDTLGLPNRSRSCQIGDCAIMVKSDPTDLFIMMKNTVHFIHFIALVRKMRSRQTARS